MGTVTGYETARGRRYRARWRDGSGRQRERRGFLTKRAARAFVGSREEATQGGRLPVEARISVGELAETWLANKAVALKPSSFSPLRTAWRVYVEPQWVTTSIGAIVPSQVETWIRELCLGTAPTARVRPVRPETRLSASVVIRAVGVLAGVLDMAVRDGRLVRNPARGVTNMPRKRWVPRRRYLSNEEVFRLASCATDPLRQTLILTLAYTGLRWGEAIALTPDDVDLGKRRLAVRRTATEVEGVIHVGPPKSWAARSVPFPAFLDQSLAELTHGKIGGALVFQAPTGGYLLRPDTARGRGSWWTAGVRKAGLEHLTPHDLRHTAASLGVSAGANVKVLQRMLGHKSAAMTLDTYADLFEDDLAAVADRLNERVLAESQCRLWARRPNPQDSSTPT